MNDDVNFHELVDAIAYSAVMKAAHAEAEEAAERLLWEAMPPGLYTAPQRVWGEQVANMWLKETRLK
jgi:hypothetical protein